MASLVEKTGWLLRIMRPVNVAIVAITQYIIYKLLLYPTYNSHAIKPVLGRDDALALIAVTAMSLAAGNIYNDIKDRKADLINKPGKAYIREGKLSMKEVKILLYTLITVSTVIVVLYSIRNRLVQFVPYFVGVAFALFIYSAYLKRTPMVGNILVAALSTLVPGIIYLVEQGAIHQLPPEVCQKIGYIFTAYITFSFLISLYREIIKDMEDQEGDRVLNASTLPIYLGIVRTRYIATGIGVCLLYSYTLWFRISTNNAALYQTLLILTLVAPTIYILWYVWNAKESSQYGWASNAVKMLMGIALIMFIITITS